MRKIGQQQEEIARHYLERQGLSLVRQNFNSRFGEIDLIMLDEKTLCYIEVRFRRSDSHGGAAASVTPAKQRKIVRTAEFFLSQHPRYQDYRMRFDTLLMEAAQVPTAEEASINWIKGAFYAS